MGQKVNPKSFRLGVTSKWTNNTFLNSKIYFSNFYKNLNIKNLLKVFLLLKSKKAILVNYFIYNTNNYNSYMIIQFYNMSVSNKKKITKTFFNNYSLIKKKNYHQLVNESQSFSNTNTNFNLHNINLKKKVLNNLILINKNLLNEPINNTNTKLLYYKNNYNFLNTLNNNFIVDNYNFNQLNNNLHINLKYNKINLKKLFSNINLNSIFLDIKLFFLIYNQFIKLHLIKNYKINDKFIFFIILLYIKKKLINKVFKYNQKFLFNLVVLNLINSIKYKQNSNFILMNIFKENLLKTLNNSNIENNINNDKNKKLEIFLNYKINYLKNIKNKVIQLQHIKYNLQKKNLFKNVFLNNLSIIKIKNLSKKKIVNHLTRKNLTYQTYNLNFFKLKKILNIINKLNLRLYFLNIKSLFNFKQLLLDKSVDFELQNQKTKRYFDIMFKLKKRFNKKWSKIQFLGMDLMNIAQYSLYFKNAKLLTHLISYQLTFLPKNKRQTAFLKYVSKIIFNFKGEFKDILGLKIKFKGRFNKWKRTKKWEAQAGNLLVQSYDSLIDYSSVKGLVKKGIFSIRLWIQFKKNSKFALKKKMNSFFQYSIFKQKLLKNESYSS